MITEHSEALFRFVIMFNQLTEDNT